MLAKRFLGCLVGLVLACGPVALTQAELMKAMDFKDKDITDILLVLGQLNGVTIVPDETVTGRASYLFSNMEFDQALVIFLDSYNLSLTKENGVYYISKIKIGYDKATNLVSMVTNNTPLYSVIKALSFKTGKTILYDSLPNDAMNITVDKVKIEEILKIFVAKYPDFMVDAQDNFFYLRRKTADATAFRPGQGTSKNIKRQGDNYSLTVDKARFKELVVDLFFQAKKEFVFLLDRDVTIENVFVSNKTFDEALKTVLLLANADVSLTNNVYYIVEVQKRDLMKKFLTTVILPLSNISAAELNRLIPASLAGASQVKIDEKSNKVILSGTVEEIQPLIDFVGLVDKPTVGGRYVRYDLNFLKTDELFPLLPQDITAAGPLALPGKMGFVINLPESKKAVLDAFLDQTDRSPNVVPIRLKYIKVEDLFAQLPPSVTDAHLTKTKDFSLFFFKGTEQQRIRFMRDLSFLDVPRTQIRYEVLVVQFEQGKGLKIDPTVKETKTQSGDSSGIVGELGNLLHINLDVVSDFGYSFGLDLSTSLSSSKAKVLADTTLNGLAGEKVVFQNTQTFRYRDTEIDTTTGKPTTSGQVRELSSGLILNFEGWVSGDNMITMKVDATLSKKGEDSSTTGIPPATSEKKISTSIRTASGKPVVLGGLKENDENVSTSQVPILGDVPVLDLLFKKQTNSANQAEFAIYIVPHVELPDPSEIAVDERLFTTYERIKKVL